MSETENIAAMAERISQEIFGVFGWDLHPASNENWRCVDQAHGRATHPSDCVFSYDEPYAHHRTYFTVDLKSYASGTIDKAKVSGALKSLALSTECANKSRQWKRIFTDLDQYARVSGLLFVYNHDGQYTGDFKNLLGLCARDGVPVAAGQRLAVLGPSDIAYLATVAADIERLRGRKGPERLPSEEFCTFWYPDLVSAVHRAGRLPATIEMLSGPWIIMKCDEIKAGDRHIRYVVWYKEHGGTADEFKYLIDYFFKYQMLNDDNSSIDVRVVNSSVETIADFRAAMHQYSTDLLALPTKRLERVRCVTVTNIVRVFNGLEVGWRNA